MYIQFGESIWIVWDYIYWHIEWSKLPFWMHFICHHKKYMQIISWMSLQRTNPWHRVSCSMLVIWFDAWGGRESNTCRQTDWWTDKHTHYEQRNSFANIYFTRSTTRRREFKYTRQTIFRDTFLACDINIFAWLHFHDYDLYHYPYINKIGWVLIMVLWNM